MGLRTMCLGAVAFLATAGAACAQLPEPRLPEAKSQTWTIKDFRFHDGSVLPQMKVHYLTLGDPRNPAVLVLHGTGGDAAGMLSPLCAEAMTRSSSCNSPVSKSISPSGAISSSMPAIRRNVSGKVAFSRRMAASWAASLPGHHSSMSIISN